MKIIIVFGVQLLLIKVIVFAVGNWRYVACL